MDDTVLNRRKYARQPIQLSALVHPELGRSWLCSIRDFCEEGMLLTGGGGSRSLASAGDGIGPGERVALHFSVATPTGHEHFRTQAQVARVLDGGNGLGIFFDDGLDKRAFRSLAEFAVATGTAVPEASEQDEDSESADASRGSSLVAQIKSEESAETTLSAGYDAQSMRDKRLSSEDAKRLLANIQKIVKRAVSRMASAYLDAIQKDFFISARDADTNAVQARYFEAMETIDKCDEAFLGRLASAIVQQIDKVSDLDTVLERRRKSESGSGDKLELVDREEFERWLLVAEHISRTENRFKDRLLDMRAQFGVLAKPWSHKDVVPVGPAALWWAFDDALTELSLHAELRREAFRGFEDQLKEILPALYRALGKLFEDSGRMPALQELRESLQPKYRVRNLAGVTVTPQDYQDMDKNLRDVSIAADGVGAGRVSENPFVGAIGAGEPAYTTARSILDIDRRTQRLLGKPREASLAAPDARPEETFNESDIVDALQTIQHEMGDAPLSDTRLRNKLMDVLRSRHGDSKGLTEHDYDTLRVMEELVASLAQDRFITDGVRDWLGRLEITLNKLAARDPEFLSGDPENPHSAVQMLNQLARLGNSNDVRQGIDREVGRRVDELLQRVVRDYDENPQVFSEVVDELHPLIDRQSKTYRGNVERTIRASEGQQKLARARRAVVDVMEDLLVGKEVPDLILELLNPGWRNLLVHSHLRNGPDSNEFREQVAIIEQLNAQLSGQIKPGDEGHVDPEGLLRRAVEGLNSISFDPSKRTPLIMRMSSALVGDATGNKAPVEKTLVQPGAAQQLLGLDGVLPDANPEADSDDASVRESWSNALERARRIQIGEWLAAADREGRPLILTVAFVGDESSSFVLVNRKGVKSMEPTLREIAEDLHKGNITLLDDYDLPLMERASQRMLENMHNELAFQASHDELTQLMNRKEFERMVEQSLSQAKTRNIQHALLYIDLDQFKIINNTSGHKAGDELLREVGEKLAGKFADQDVRIARLGGDEFGILAEHIDSYPARELADDVLDAIRALSFAWDGRSYAVTASIGLVFVDQSTGGVGELMQHADEACFAAKDAGRNRVQEYELGDTRMMKRHGAMEWVTQLDAALEEDRLILNCQKIKPVAADAAPQDEHYEILLTMQDELGDVVAPTELINAAETYNRMTTVDRWVIRKVLQWMSDNRAMLDDFGGFAINVSGHSVNDSTFPDFVLEQFGRTQAPTSKVCFEITETAAIANLDNAVDFMNRMRIIGCRFSLDDFGTGLSSYSYLRNLPVDYVKIDGVFVKDIAENPADYAVVRSINEIGHYMGKRTVAEFVESDETLRSVSEIGVDFVQGYQVSKPCPLEELRV